MDIRQWFNFRWSDALPDWNWGAIIPDLPDFGALFSKDEQAFDVQLEVAATKGLRDWEDGLVALERYRQGLIDLDQLQAEITAAQSQLSARNVLDNKSAEDMLWLIEELRAEAAKPIPPVTPQIEDPQTLIEAARVADELKQAYPELTAAAQATQAEVTSTLSSMSAQLEAVDYSYHGSRLMETFAAGISASSHFVTSAISSALAEARAYLPSSPAKRGPLSDIHKLKFMETVAASVNAAPLLEAIGTATGLARRAMQFTLEPVAIRAQSDVPPTVKTVPETPSQTQDPQNLLQAARAVSELQEQYPVLSFAAQATEAEVTSSIAAMNAQLEATEYSYHGSRLMETFAAGISASSHFVTSAISSALAEARAYLPSSPAKRGPLSDIHKLKFMETVAASVNAAPLMNAIGNVTSMARRAMNFAPEPIKIGARFDSAAFLPEPVRIGARPDRPDYAPIADGAGSFGGGLTVKFENHYHGNVDEKVVTEGNADLIRQMERWWASKQNEKKRRDY